MSMREGLEKQRTPPVRSSARQTLGAPISLISLTLKLNKTGPHAGFFCSWLPRQMLGLFKVRKKCLQLGSF